MIANYPIGNRFFSPEFDEKPDRKTVVFELEDFFGSQEKTLHCVVEVNGHYTDNEIISTEVVDDIGNFQDVYPFLTEDQKHDIRLEANYE